MHKRFSGLLAALAVLLLAGCGTIVHKQSVGQASGPRKIVVFFDGTHNDEASDTNVKRLHSLVTLRGEPQLYTLYVEGVGTGSDVIGMGAGAGIGERVRLGYAFILQHYRARAEGRDSGDEIYIVGFSRGAYAARILNSLLYRAGLPAKPAERTYAQAAQSVYEAVTGHFDATRTERVRAPAEIEKALAKDGMRSSAPVRVQALALWDTVAALGLPQWGSRLADKAGIEPFVPNVDDASRRYGDTLCNVKAAYHALAIDDDREWIFTPLLLARAHLFEGCDDARSHITLREVWFAGAHSDVGGGYEDTQLSGVSLNWMIRQLADTGLLPDGARVREDVHGTSHDPEAGKWSPLYHRMNRNIAGYAFDPASLRKNTLCVHSSVFERRRVAAPQAFENHQLDLRRPGQACLAVQDTFRGRRKEIAAADCRQETGVLALDVREFADTTDPRNTPACLEGLSP